MLNPAQLKAAGPHTLFPLPSTTVRADFWQAAKDISRSMAFDAMTLGLSAGAVFRTKTKLKEAWQYFKVHANGGFVRVDESAFIAYIEKATPPAVSKVTPVPEIKPEPVKEEAKPVVDVKKDEAAEKPAAKSKTKAKSTEKKDEAKPAKTESKEKSKKLVPKTGVDSTKYSYVVQDGMDTSATIIDSMEKLVRGSGVKAPSDLGTRLRSAKLLVAAQDADGKVVGCLGLQLKPKDYVDGINSKAEAKLAKDALELCWIRLGSDVPSEEKDTVVKAMFESLKLGKSTRPAIASAGVYAVYNVADDVGTKYMTLLKMTKHKRTHAGLVKEAQLYTL